MNLKPEGSGALRVTDPNELKRLLEEDIPIVQDGYLHAYVANHSSKPSLFDNIMVTLLRGKTWQINHYYPYGLSISGIGGDYDEYLNKYTGKELQTGEFDPAVSTGLEMFDFHARFYDPQVGRWFTPDPAEQFHNPYLAMANNPVRYTDPTGTYVPMRYWLGGDGGDGGGGGGGGSGSSFGYNTQNSGNPWMLTSSSWANAFRTEEYNRAFLSLNAQNAMYGPQIPRYYLGNKVSYNATKGGYGYWNDHNEYTTDGVVSEKYGTTQGILFPVSEWVSLGSEEWASFDKINYGITGVAAVSAMFGGNYGLTSGQIFKYAQRINGKVISAAEITAASTAQSLRVARVLGKISLVGSVIGTGVSVNNIVTDLQQGGWEQVNGWDLSDAAVGTTGIVTGIFLAATPLGWGIAIGVGVYFAARLVHDISTEP